MSAPLLPRAIRFDPLRAAPGRAPGGLAVEATRLDAHRAALGPAGDPATLIDRVAAAGLTGCGGGHFPVDRKWATALRAGGGGVVVANLAEGEPASAKDAALAQTAPHLILDGLAAVARAIGAERTVLWLHDDASHTRLALGRALAERAGASAGAPWPEVALAPHGYLSGESSAVVRALSGGPALPQTKRTPAAAAGVGGRPTVVHNAETLARVALVDRGLDPGGALATVTTDTGLVALQAVRGESVGAVIRRARPAAPAPHAVLVGGYGGRWVAWESLAARPYERAALGAAGVSLGAGILIPADPGVCGLRLTAGIVDYLAASSARQCGPCLFGLAELAEAMQRLADRRPARTDLERLDRLCALVRGRGACHHPDGAAQLVASTLEVFAADVASHRRRQCVQDASPRSRARRPHRARAGVGS